jgi:CRP-like cAMP-binding protein
MKVAADIQPLVEKAFKDIQTYPVGTHVYSEGEQFTGVYYIQEGKIQLLKSGLNKQMTMWFGGPKEFIGIAPFFNNSKTYSTTALVTGSVATLIRINEGDFKDFINNHPKIQKEIVSELCQKISLTEMRINNSFHQSTRLRFIDTVTFLVRQDCDDLSDQLNNGIVLNYSVENLSEISGISIKYLKKLLNEFEENKLIKAKGSHLDILDFNKFVTAR